MLNNNKVNKVMENGFNEKMYKLLENANDGLLVKEWAKLIVDLYYMANDNIQVRNVYECTCNHDKRNMAIVEFIEDGKMKAHVILCNYKAENLHVYEVNGEEIVYLHKINLFNNVKDVKDLYVPFNKALVGKDAKIIKALYNRKADNCLIYKFEEKKEVKKEVKNNKVNVENVIADNKNYNRYKGVDYMKNLVNNNVIEKVAVNKVEELMNNEKIAKLADMGQMDIGEMKVKDLFEAMDGVKDLQAAVEENPIIKLMLDDEDLKGIKEAIAVYDKVNDLKVVEKKEVKKEEPKAAVNVLNDKPEFKFNNKADNYRNALYVPKAKFEEECEEEEYVQEDLRARNEEYLACLFSNKNRCRYM